MLMRPGNAGANNADDHITLIRSAYRALPGSQRGGNIGRRILVRTDGAGGTKNVVAYLHSRGFAYSLGLRVNEKIGALVSTMSDDVKQGAYDPASTEGSPIPTPSTSQISPDCWSRARPVSTGSTSIASRPAPESSCVWSTPRRAVSCASPISTGGA